MALPTDELRKMRCAMCAADADCNDIVLAARCHPKAGVEVANHGNLLGLRCHDCGELVAELEAPQDLDVSRTHVLEDGPVCDGCPKPINIIQPECHPKDAVDVLYMKRSHSLILRCKTCEKIVGTIPLSPPN